MKPAAFEWLAARFLSRLLSRPVLVARTGQQYGGDGGTAGAGDRYLRIECKRYKDTTSFNLRELLGEIDEAVRADEALEAWVLATTRGVDEQLVRELRRHAGEKGVAVLFFAWDDPAVPTLGALCAAFPEEMDGFSTTVVLIPSKDFRVAAQAKVEILKHGLEEWALGCETVRQAAIGRLLEVWREPRQARAFFGQDVAGGNGRPRIRRKVVLEKLSQWWKDAAVSRQPLAVIGGEGVGKTFNTVDWLVENRATLPIVLTMSSGAFSGVAPGRPSEVERVLANHLYGITRVRDEEFWLGRIRRMLKRPEGEGFAIVLFVDGLNQEPSVRWLDVLSQLQSNAFFSRIAVMISVRQFSFVTDLSDLRGLNPAPVSVSVDSYDLGKDGEFDQMLAKHDLCRADIAESLISIASIPRFFDLVVDLRDRLSGLGEITVHRLLLEYGRDMRRRRDERSFSESEWQAWLIKLAKAHQAKRSISTVDELAELTGGRHLTAEQIAIRNSDIIDGAFAKRSSTGEVELDPLLVNHALGLDLLETLLGCSSRAAVKEELNKWLDPLRGFDDEPEILRAAVNLAAERRHEDEHGVLEELLYDWLNAQNSTESHREELTRLAPAIIGPLFGIVERTVALTNRAPFHYAMVALKAVDPNSEPYLEEVKRRVMDWHTDLPLEFGLYGRGDQAQKSDDERRGRFEERVGTSTAGPRTVLEHKFNIVEDQGSRLVGVGAYVLQGCPLQGMVDVFVHHAVFASVRGYHQDHENYRWLCWLNEVDPTETAEALREAAMRVAQLDPEPGVHEDLPASVASQLHWLTGRPADDRRAVDLQPHFDKVWDYERDYLNDPARSFFAVERRHGDKVLAATAIPVLGRVERIKDLLVDPTFDIPDHIAREVRKIAESFDVSELNRDRNLSPAQHQYKRLSLALARLDPQALAEMERRRLRGYADRPAEQRHSCALAVCDGLLLVSAREREPIRRLAELEEPGIDQVSKDLSTGVLYVAGVQGLAAVDQYRKIIYSDVRELFASIATLLPTLSASDADVLIDEAGYGKTRAAGHLMGILAHNPPTELSERAWKWAQTEAFGSGTTEPGQTSNGDEDKDLRPVAFKLLAGVDAMRFGQLLETRGWSWAAGGHLGVNHYGSEALSKANNSLPVIDIVSRLAPWHLFSAMSERQVSREEIALVLEAFNGVLLQAGPMPEPSACLSVDRSWSRGLPGAYRISISSDEAAITDSVERLRRREEFDKRWPSVIEEARRRVDEARKSGASLYLMSMETEDLDIILDHVPNAVDEWLSGLDEPSTVFLNRLRRAEGFFMALCEQLLNRDPKHGVQLWRAIEAYAATNFIGTAGIPHIYHLAFSAPQSPETDALCEELMSFDWCDDDDRLEEVAILLREGDRVAWAKTKLEKEAGGEVVWRRLRAARLLPLLEVPELPCAEAWPDGPSQSSEESARRMSYKMAHKEACSRYWLRAYAGAKTLEDAHAAWQLFKACASRRTWLWWVDEFAAHVTAHRRRKEVYAEADRDALETAIRDSRNFLNSKLYGKSTPSALELGRRAGPPE